MVGQSESGRRGADNTLELLKFLILLHSCRGGHRQARRLVRIVPNAFWVASAIARKTDQG